MLRVLNNLGNVAPIQSVCVNAPKLIKASLSYVKELVTEGEGLLELVLMCHVKPRIQSMPSLSSLHMHGHSWELDSISEYIRLATSIQHLHIDVKLEEKHPLRIDHFLGQLQHVNSLYIGSDFFKVWAIELPSVLIEHQKRRVCICVNLSFFALLSMFVLGKINLSKVIN